ncbi:Polysaccharide deacetylase [compost metagenome]
MVTQEDQMRDCRYLIRFDDICPTMNWEIWEAVESLLLRHDVRPILAVVPDNQDSKLVVDPPNPEFWARVRNWQSLGFTIALHGFRHVYVNQNAGMMGLTRQSEFAGLSRAEQKNKLQQALAIFVENGVRADAWVAPSHSFDRTTVEVLAEVGIRVISDGLWPWPHSDERGILWVPQQLWGFQQKDAGIWTVCYHHNRWTSRNLDELSRNLEVYSSQFTDVPSVARDYVRRRLNWQDRVEAFSNWLWNHRLYKARGWVYGIRERVRLN